MGETRTDFLLAFVHRHVSDGMFVWIYTKYVADGMSTFITSLNCSVHVITCTYYLLATFEPVVQKVINPIKPFITILQMASYTYEMFARSAVGAFARNDRAFTLLLCQVMLTNFSPQFFRNGFTSQYYRQNQLFLISRSYVIVNMYVSVITEKPRYIIEIPIAAYS